jgi:hypothetical protein
MPFGLDIYRASGRLAYSSVDVTWNQVDFFLVTANGSVQNSYPVLAGKEVLVTQIMIDPPPIDRRALAHTITVSGALVTASGGSENCYVLVLMR